MSKALNLVGKKFGRLTVIFRAGSNEVGRSLWLCKCDCGKEVTCLGKYLNNGNVKSCGCMVLDGSIGRTHGMKDSPEYTTWCNIKGRCYNVASSDYPDYGGRGIIMCERWKNSFENFYADMGPRPSSKHSIDRKDNNGPYSNDNCRWATAGEQARNKRNNVKITFHGRAKILADWEKELGIPQSRILARLRLGWTVEEALTVQLNVKIKSYRRLSNAFSR